MTGLKAFTIFVLLWSAVLTAFNYTVDPIQFYRKDPDPVFLKNMRYQVPGLLRQYEFDTIIVGTSHSANFSPADLDQRIGTESLGLSINGATGWEQSQIVSLALQMGSLENVLWEMNYRTIAENAEVRVKSGVFPLHLYTGEISSNFLYLFSVDTAWMSTKHQLGIGHRDIHTINAWGEKFANRFDGKYVRNHYCTRQALEYRGMGIYPDYDRALELHVADHVENHPDLTFFLFLPPLSYFNYLLADEAGRFMAFRQSLYRFARSHSNVLLFDFNTRFDWIGDAINYKDVEHYSPQISGEMLKAISERESHVSHSNADIINREFKSYLAEKRRTEPPCIAIEHRTP